MNLPDVYGIKVYRTQRRRVGRGWGSGEGKTSGRGEKGAGRRSGTRFRLRFEGGQMPLYRRLPKKGFSNHAFRVRYLGVNVGDLEKNFDTGAVIDLDALRSHHMVPKSTKLWKLLGDGTPTKAFTVKAHAASAGAKQKLEAAGGSLQILEGKHLDRAVEGAERRKNLAARAEVSLAAAKAEVEKAAKARAEKPASAKGEKPAKKAGGGGKPGGKPEHKGEGGGEKPKGQKGGGGKPKGDTKDAG
jgi:large subunit ribosomal protein L15